MYQDQFDAAIPLFETSLQLYFSHHYNRYAALAYNDLGYTSGRNGNLSKQAEYLLMSIYIYENIIRRSMENWSAYSNLSTVYYGLNERSKAMNMP
ncbi:MAG: hypothetical protein IPL55_24215 [Saprospiraceae bacterium]|nr:hypothetical protein [Saprospiraceae bacterium]